MADGTKLLVLRDPGDLVENTSLLDGKAARESGFVDRSLSTISFVDGTRTFTITPTAVSFEYFQDGTRYTQVGADSLVITDTEGPHYVYYEGADLKSTTVFSSSIISLYAFVVAIYWDATNGEAIIFADERHGNIMDSATHEYEHETFGARFGGGLGLANMDVDGSGNDATAAQFAVGDGAIWDEDIKHTITNGVPQTLSLIAEIPMFYRSGAAGAWRRVAATLFPITTTGTGRAAWNELTGGAYQLTEVGNNDYVLTHYYATGDTRHPIIGAVGQAEYSTVAQARAGALTELQILGFGAAEILTPEFLPFATVIWQTANSYSNAVQSRVRSTDAGADYIDWRVARGSSGSGGAPAAAPVFLDSEFAIVDETNLFRRTLQLFGLSADREITALDAAGVDVLSDAALTAESIPFVDSSGRLDEDQTFVPFVRDAANGRIGLGTDTQEGILHVVDETWFQVVFDRYNNAAGGMNYSMRKARGTKASPTVVNANDFAASLVGYGWDGAAFDPIAAIRYKITAVSAGNLEGALVFNTSDSTGTTADHAVLDGNGDFGFGNLSPGSRVSVTGAVSNSAEIDNGNSGASATIDWTAGNAQKITLSANATLSFTGVTGAGMFWLRLVQDGTGSRTVTWPATAKWPGGVAPTLTTTAAAVDVVLFLFDGTDYHGDAARLDSK